MQEEIGVELFTVGRTFLLPARQIRHLGILSNVFFATVSLMDFQSGKRDTRIYYFSQKFGSKGKTFSLEIGTHSARRGLVIQV